MKKQLVMIAFMFVLSATYAEKSIIIDGVAANANEHVITIAEVMMVAQPLQKRLMGQYTGARLIEEAKKVYDVALHTVIERYLIIDAYKEQQMQIPDWVVAKRVDEIIESSFGGDKSRLLDALSKEQITYEEWRNKINDQIIVQAMHDSNVGQNVNISLADTRKEYDVRRSEYAMPEKVQISMIVLNMGENENDAVAARGQAVDILKKAKEGVDFGKLASEYSTGVKADEGGDWGWMELEMLRRELVDALSGLKKGELSGAVEIEGEIYILLVQDRKQKEVSSFDDVRPEIERVLRGKESERLYDAWVKRLKDAAYVKVFDVDLF